MAQDKSGRARLTSRSPMPRFIGILKMKIFACGTIRAMIPRTMFVSSKATSIGAAMRIAITNVFPISVTANLPILVRILKSIRGTVCKLSAIAKISMRWSLMDKNNKKPIIY
jgi:hypothetical protein